MRLRLLPLLLALTASAAGSFSVCGQDTDSVHAGFVINRADLEPDATMMQMFDSARRLQDQHRLLKVYITGSASPDGPLKRNERLARERGEVAYRLMMSEAHVPDSLIVLKSMGENWTQFLGMCRRQLPEASAAEVEALCSSTPDRELRKKLLREARGGALWEELKTLVLPRLRYAIIIFDALPPRIEALHVEALHHRVSSSRTADKAEMNLFTFPEHIKQIPYRIMPLPFEPHFYVKSNAPAWLCMWMNAAVEFDLCPHLTAQLPIYYSGFDYFRRDLKFRTFAFQPEVRWFPSMYNRGFFVGAHFGCGWYNVALRGDYRYQDHDGDTPAIGGGIAAGYRLRFGKTKRWFAEFSVGAGVYRLDYDKFLNYKNGLLVGRDRRTFFGVDQAAVSFGYTFDLRRKEKGGGK